MKLKCPHCKKKATSKVVDVETVHGGTVRRRRRQCSRCGKRYTTAETIVVPRPERIES